MCERGISLFPAPVAGWLTLRLSTAGCHIFGKSQTVGYHIFGNLKVQVIYLFVECCSWIKMICIQIYNVISKGLLSNPQQ